MPRLKYRDCTANRGVSGSKRTAKGSSNDSSICCCVKEPSKLKDGLFQSNSIIEFYCKSNAHAMCIHCIYITTGNMSTGKNARNGAFARMRQNGTQTAGGGAA